MSCRVIYSLKKLSNISLYGAMPNRSLATSAENWYFFSISRLIKYFKVVKMVTNGVFILIGIVLNFGKSVQSNHQR